MGLLTGCTMPKMPWDKGEDTPATDDFPDDDFGGMDSDDGFNMGPESVASGMIYNVGDTINATDVITYDTTKVTTACVFVVDGMPVESITCDAPGEYTVQALVQYEDFTEWSGDFSYSVEGAVVEIPQYIYSKIVSDSYTKELVTLDDGFMYSIMWDGSEMPCSDDSISGERINGYTKDEWTLYYRMKYANLDVDSYWDRTLEQAVTLAVYLNEILNTDYGSEEFAVKVLKYVYNIQSAESVNGSNGSNWQAVNIAKVDPTGNVVAGSPIRQLADAMAKKTTEDSGKKVYSTNNDEYAFMKTKRTFDPYQILGVEGSVEFETAYTATIDSTHTLTLSGYPGVGIGYQPWSFKVKGQDTTVGELLNDESKLAELALAVKIPDYTEATFTDYAAFSTWVRSLFVGENAVFEASLSDPCTIDPARGIESILIGDWNKIVVDSDVNGILDDVNPDDQQTTEQPTDESGVQVVHKKSYQQQHPGLFEWPESDIIYRRWIYTIGEEDEYQGTIYLADGTILQGTSGLNVWTGEYTPTTDYTTKTHTMRTANVEYDLTNEKDTSYVINTGRSNSSTTTITKGKREYLLSNVNQGWITNASNTPIYQSWQNAASFEAVAGSTYSNNGFLTTPFTARIITGAGSNDYPYFVEMVYGEDYFVVYGATNDVDINEMLFIADNMIKAKETEEQ